MSHTQTKCQASPTLGLVNDCFQFVATFFEVINASAPHIYHSALPLSPRTSTMWKLYKPYANPLVRLVFGIPTSWGSSTATFKHANKILAVAWSPCSRFIAVATGSSGGIQILDAVTLDQLLIMSPIPLEEDDHSLKFSPGGHFLTLCLKAHQDVHIVSWDVQTGGLTCNVELSKTAHFHSMTYSECGTMVGCLFVELSFGATICTCNILTNTSIATHVLREKAMGVWTHGNHLKFATLNYTAITIWEAEFTFVKPPKAIQSLPIPPDIDYFAPIQFNPTLNCLGFYSKSIDSPLIVWDTQHSTSFLDWIDPHHPTDLFQGHTDHFRETFSPDGHLFAYTIDSGVSIWKHSPTGYTHLQNIAVQSVYGKVHFSPNRKFILVRSNPDAFQLWPTEDPVTSLHGPSSQTLHQEAEDFALEFCSANSVVVVVRNGGKVVTVLDLSCGSPQLTIDMNTEVYGVGVVENAALVFSDGKVFTWNIPIRGGAVDCRVNISNSISTTRLDNQWESKESDKSMLASLTSYSVAISPDSQYVAIGRRGKLYTCDMATGNCLENGLILPTMVWFTPDSSEVQCLGSSRGVHWWKIDKDTGFCITELVDQSLTEDLPGFPWFSTLGNKITDNGWLLNPSGKQLLWLPHHWRLGDTRRTRKWSRHYLALLHGGLSEPVILDLQPEELLNN